MRLPKFAKRPILGLVDRLGYEVRRKLVADTTLLRRDLRDSLSHMRDLGFAPCTVIDVGVAEGTPALYETFPNAFHLLVEPLQEFEPALRSICQRYRGDYVLAAASTHSGAVTFNVHTNHLEGSSMLRESEGSHVDGTPRTVPTARIDGLCKERVLSGPFLLKVDVQGNELDVVASADGIITEIQTIILEVSLFESMVGAPQFADVVAAMKKRGFSAYDIFGGRNRPLDSALAQIDIAFVRENGLLRQTHAYASPEQRQAMLKL